MDTKKIVLLFEKKSNLEIIRSIIYKDPAFLYSLLKLAGSKKCPDLIDIKLGLVEKKE